jgi:hypothetical protein
VLLFLSTLVFLTLASVAPSPDASELEIPLVRALSSLDGVAVVQTKKGEIETRRVGDDLVEGLRIVKVLEDRLVVEGADPGSGEPKTYWVYRAGRSEKTSRVVAFSRKGPTPQPSGTPAGDAVELEKARPKKNPE